MGKTSNTTNTLLIVISSFMTLTLAVLVVFVVSVLFAEPDDYLLEISDGEFSAQQSTWWGTAPIVCQPQQGPTCPSNCMCINGRCEFSPPVEPGTLGESCRDRDCADGLYCHLNTCVDTPPVNYEACQDPEVIAAITRLNQKCASRSTSLEEVVAKGNGCNREDWKALALDDTQFDKILAAFPHRIVLHFPFARPGTRKRSAKWPDSAQKAYYLQSLREVREHLQHAEQVFIVGRASPEGNANTNYKVATMRMDFAHRMLLETLGDVWTPDEAAQKLEYWSLGGEMPLRPEYFKYKYSDHSITWDEKSLAKLERLLKKDTWTARERDWLVDTINRITLIIPIPCKLGKDHKSTV